MFVVCAKDAATARLLLKGQASPHSHRPWRAIMAATCPIHFDVETLHDYIRAEYTRVADDPTGEFHFHRGAQFAARFLGYDAAELSTLPERATSRFAGVGNPLAIAHIASGQTVLD